MINRKAVFVNNLTSNFSKKRTCICGKIKAADKYTILKSKCCVFFILVVYYIQNVVLCAIIPKAV